MALITKTVVKRGSQTTNEVITLLAECKTWPDEYRTIAGLHDCLHVFLCDLLLAICDLWTMLGDGPLWSVMKCPLHTLFWNEHFKRHCLTSQHDTIEWFYFQCLLETFS